MIHTREEGFLCVVPVQASSAPDYDLTSEIEEFSGRVVIRRRNELLCLDLQSQGCIWFMLNKKRSALHYG